MANSSDYIVIYLHGFLSSSNAYKAQLTARYLTQFHPSVIFLCPDLANHPAAALQQLQQLIEKYTACSVLLIGSSLGGFYATWLAQYYAIKAVLVNPAVRPHELMLKYLGEQRNPYSQACFQITEYDMQVLEQHYVATIENADKLLLLLQMADEVLDAREASARFYASRCIIEPQGNHQFQGFENFLPLIMQWLLE